MASTTVGQDVQQTAVQQTPAQPQPQSAQAGQQEQPRTTTDRFEIAFGFKTKTEKDGVTVVKNDKGNPVRDATTISVEDATELEKKGLFEGQVVTVSCDYPANWEALIAMANKAYTDDDGKPRDAGEVKGEMVKLFRNGAAAKVMNRMRAKLTKLDENDSNKLAFKDTDAPGGVLDMTNEITSGSLRVFLTEEQKTWKSLSNLTPVVRETVWKAYLSATGKDFYIPAE